MRLKLNSMTDILRARGLEPDGRAQKVFTMECARHMDKYVPMETGTLKNTRFIGPDYVRYEQPHARYQYYGQLMLSPTGSAWARRGERKHLADRGLTYRGAPTRGKLWDKRMWAEDGKKISRLVAGACGGRAK